MKKHIALILAIIMLLFTFMLPITATETVEDDSYTELSREVVSYTVNYSSDEKKIEVHGKVNYDAFVSYNKYTIEIYKVLPTQNVRDAVMAENAKPDATMAIAVKFDMSFDITSFADKAARYAVILRSPEGKSVLAAAPRYVSVPMDAEDDEQEISGFKGIVSSNDGNLSIYGDMGFGTVIIPVYYDKLLNSSQNGYMYPHENDHIYFDKVYIDLLSSKIKTYTASGTRVYLQLLLPTGATVLEGSNGTLAIADYDMPNVYSESTAAFISTFVRYLSETYDSYLNGKISGFIVGDKIDTFRGNYQGGSSIDEYAMKYAYYLNIVANSARQVNASLDVVIPFSNFDGYTDTEVTYSSGFMPSLLLEKIADALDNSLSVKLEYSVLLSGNITPLTANTEDNSGGELVPNTEDTIIGVDDFSVYTDFLDGLKKKYMSVPENCIYVWELQNDMYGDELCAAYAYSYYTMLHTEGVLSFVISFDNAHADALEDIIWLIEVIDTQTANEKTADILTLLGAKAWDELVEDFSLEKVVKRNYEISDNTGFSEISWIGSFSYMNFTSGNINGWSSTSFGKNLKSDYNEEGVRALCQVIERSEGLAHSDLIYLYEHEENLVYTPALCFELEITDSENNGGLYEVTIMVGKNNNAVKDTFTVKSGELNKLWLNVGSFNDRTKAEYIKISTRSLTGSGNEYSLWLYDIVGHSEKYNNEELAELISEERLKTKDNDESDSEITNNDAFYWIVLVIILFGILVAGALFVIFRRDESGKKKRIKNGISKEE